jgi:hypothetical protein
MSKTIYESTVTGRGAFPVDMLRYDRCFPATERDAIQIGTSFGLRMGVTDASRSFTICVISEHPLTSARWSSFGWQVDEIKTRRF